MNSKKLVLNAIGIAIVALMVTHCGKKKTTDDAAASTSNLPSKISSSAG